MDKRSTEILYGILSYLSILVLVPIIAGKDSNFCRFHANQGLVLLIAQIIAIALRRVDHIMSMFGIVGSLLSVACFVFCIIGIINAARMETTPLPIIGGIKIL